MRVASIKQYRGNFYAVIARGRHCDTIGFTNPELAPFYGREARPLTDLQVLDVQQKIRDAFWTRQMSYDGEQIKRWINDDAMVCLKRGDTLVLVHRDDVQEVEERLR